MPPDLYVSASKEKAAAWALDQWGNFLSGLNFARSQMGRAVLLAGGLNWAGLWLMTIRRGGFGRTGGLAGGGFLRGREHHDKAREVPARCWPRIPFSF